MALDYCPVHNILFDNDVDICCAECESDGHDPDCARKEPQRPDPTLCDCGVIAND